jgi:predicted Holliday junction resolvase-like endonuclease
MKGLIMTKLADMDVGLLTNELDEAMAVLDTKHGEYAAEIDKLQEAQDKRIEAVKKENEIKNNIKIIRSGIEKSREYIKAIKISLRAENISAPNS